MKIETKKLWLEAIRSGIYKKNVNRLRNNDKFCLQGILVDVAVQHGICEWVRDFEYKEEVYGVEQHGKILVATIPLVVREWAGLPLEGPISIRFKEEKKHLYDVNDRFRLSLDEMADLIESDESL